MTHLTAEVVIRWNTRTLEPSETLAVIDHLAQCEECRSMVRCDRGLQKFSDELRRQSDDDQVARHLTNKEIIALFDRSASQEIHGYADNHLLRCSECRAELDDLRKFAAPDRPMRSGAWPIAAAIAALTFGVAFWLSASYHETRPTLRTPPAPAVLVMLRDASGEIELLADGEVRGVPTRLRTAVETLLRAPSLLELPEVARAVVRLPEGQRLIEHRVDEFKVMAPISTVELDERPLFRWSGPDGALFSVAVLDEHFELIAESGSLSIDSWRPAQGLPRNQLLNWQVEVTINSESVVYPRPPDPPAVFRIASQEQVASVASAREHQSHLLIGLALWDAGRVREAATEFENLRALNPDSAVASALSRRAQELIDTLSTPAAFN